ncbi:hypothetical protein CLOP_g4823 [Closterium sp. NIES-67]|nr:hypothetical protein CLOP_g4823 [Closterium sp. NIES-67]
MALLPCSRILRAAQRVSRRFLLFSRTRRLLPLILLSLHSLSAIPRVACSGPFRLSASAVDDGPSRATRAPSSNPGRSEFRSTSAVDADPSRVCRELVEPHGFTCEDHRVVTRDGFILGLQRVASRQVDARGGSPGAGSTSSSAASNNRTRSTNSSGGSSNSSSSSSSSSSRSSSSSSSSGEIGSKSSSSRGPVLLQHGLFLAGEMDMVRWWTWHGTDHPALTALACRVLTQAVSAAACERNWAVWDSVHTAKRNRLGSEKCRDLVYGAESWVVGPPGLSLPFLLVRLGFEVWLGNSRCGPWSYGHVTWEPKDKRYWEWTWADMAANDLPAQIDYILSASRTGARQVFYVGHSQGTLTFLASLSGGRSLDIFQARFPSSPPSLGGTFPPPLSLLPSSSPRSPPLAHLSSPVAHEAAKLDLDRFVRATHLHEFSLRNALGELVVATACASPRINCSSLLSAFTGPNCCIDIRYFAKLVPWFPLASSVKNMAHFGQMVRSGEWKQFDYGFLKNWLRYHQSTPPFFRPSAFPSTIRLAIAYGGRDSLAAPADVEWFISKLAQRPKVMYMPNYAHLDFLFASFVVEDVYTQIVRFFTDYGLDRAYE